MTNDNVKMFKTRPERGIDNIQNPQASADEPMKREALKMAKAAWGALGTLTKLYIVFFAFMLVPLVIAVMFNDPTGANKILHWTIDSVLSERGLIIGSVAFTTLVAGAYFRILTAGGD